MTKPVFWKKGLVVAIIVLFIGIGFTSVTAIKSDVSETKVKPVVSPSGIDVYRDCDIITDNGSSQGIAFLFPGYVKSNIYNHKIAIHNANGIVLNIHYNIDDFPVSIDGNSYYNDDWDLMIVSNYEGFLDNYSGGPSFLLDGNASRVIVINF